jgi:hypothetical protein
MPPDHPVASADEIREALKTRVKVIKPPPDMALSFPVSDAALREFGLPPQPNPQDSPNLAAQFRATLSAPLRFLEPEFAFELTPGRAWRLAGSFSDNWSGAFIRCAPPDRLVRVQASWIVPNPFPPPVPSGAMVDDTYGSSTWIGLDGHDPTSQSMPQIGTAQFVEVKNGVSKVTTSAWYQWWVRGKSSPPITLPNFIVSPGDLMFCELVKIDPKKVNMRFKNRSSGLSFALEMTAPTKDKDGSPIDVEIEGLTAEWIMERPADLHDSNHIYRLPQYGATAMYGCRAGLDPSVGHGAGELDLQDAGLIRMVDDHDPIMPGIVVSTPAKRGDDTILLFSRGNEI